MRKKTLNFLLIPFLILILCSVGLAQRQTGSLKGMVGDEEGNPLPGVTVTVNSPKMQGQQAYISTAEGNFRFPALPPGTYTLRAELSGFQTINRPGIVVSVGKVVTVTIEIRVATLEEEVTVVAAAPVVDVELTGIKVTITKDILDAIPMRRTFLDVYRAAPATAGQDETYDYQKWSSVHGGALHESKTSVDGVDLVDLRRGYIAGDISFDAIEEIEMALGGHQAEVGQVAAGYINVVTQSGGNKFSGRLTFVGNHEALTQNVIPQEQLDAVGLEEAHFYKYQADIGFYVGGPIIKDRFWFFITPRYINKEKSTFFIPFTDPDGIYHPEYPYKHQEYTQLHKLTFQVTKKLKWMGMYQYFTLDTIPDAWDINDKYTPLESQQAHTLDKTHTISSMLTLVMDQNTFAEARLGYWKRHNQWTGATIYTKALTGPADRFLHYDKYTRRYWGAGKRSQQNYKESITLSLNVTRFQDNFLGMAHEFKAGVEYNRGTSSSEHSLPIPYEVFWYNGTPWYYGDSVPYKGRVRIAMGDLNRGDMPHWWGTYRWSGFIQDSLKIAGRFTLNIGIRYDETHGFKKEELMKGWTDPYFGGLANAILPEIFVKEDLTAPGMKDIVVYKAFAPRVGLSYDLFGTGKTALKASWSRYSEILLTETVEHVEFLPPQRVDFTWWDDNQNGIYDLPPIDRYRPGSYDRYVTDEAEFRKLVHEDLTAPYTDEWIVGIQHELVKDFSISLDFILKSTRNLVGLVSLINPRDSDVWVPYTTTDPGMDGEFGTGDEQELTVYMLKEEAESEFYQKQNIEDARRNFWGVDLIFFKRMSNNWQFTGNISYSDTYGNYPHGDHVIRGTTNWSNPNGFLFREGKQEFDRPLGIKLMATVILPYGINVSGFYRYVSGAPWGRDVTVFFPEEGVDGFLPKSSSVGVKAEAVGERRTVPQFNNFDLRIEKEFNLGPGKLGIWIEVFNVFGYYIYSIVQNPGGDIYPDGTFQRYYGYGDVLTLEGNRTLNFALRYTF